MSENKKISQEIKDVTPTSAGGENTVQKADKRKFKFDRKWFSRWYYNNNLLAVAALLISVICWVVLTLNVTADTSKTFTDIPIKIDTQALEENLGLHMISVLDPSTYTDRKADVTVSGSIYQLSKVTTENISITAQVSNVTKAGEYILTLTPVCSVRDVKVQLEDNYNFIKIWFDRYQEKTVTIDKVIAIGASASSEDLLVGDTYSSIKSLLIKGPESLIEQIDSVQVRADVNRALSQTEEIGGFICFINESGEVLDETLTNYIKILDYNNIGEETGTAAGAPASAEITVTIPIRKTVQLPLKLNFKNIPDGFDASTLKYTISPNKVTLEGDVDAIDKLTETGYYGIDEVDMTTLSPSNSSFNIKLNLSTGIEEQGGITDVSVKFDMTDYASKKVTIVNNGSFALTNAEKINGTVTSESVDVYVVGPSAVVKGLTSADFIVTVDMSSYDGFTGQRKMEASISLKNKKNCWIYGTYTVMVSTI